MARNLIAQTSHVLVWPLPTPDDRKHLADLAGVALGELERGLEREPFGFLWIDLPQRRLVHCPTLRL